MKGGLESLVIYTIDVSDYTGIGGQIFFPFTLGYGFKEYEFMTMTRLSAGFREAGIAQAFIAACIIGFPKIENIIDAILISLIIVSGFATQSTSGIATVGLALLVRMLIEQDVSAHTRIFLGAIGILIAIIALDVALNDTSVGFENKVETESYWDRKNQMDNGLRVFFENPFGVGTYSKKEWRRNKYNCLPGRHRNIRYNFFYSCSLCISCDV